MKVNVSKKVEYDFKIEDSDWGQEAINFKVDFLADLFDPINARRQGRSTMLALAFIKLALRHPTKEIYLLDHYQPSKLQQKKSFLALIESILIENKICFPDMFRFDENKFTLTFIPSEVKTTSAIFCSTIPNCTFGYSSK